VDHVVRIEARDGPTLRKVLLACILGGCNNLPNEVLYDATRPSRAKQCVDALSHVSECDVRFPDRAELCSYSAGGDCAPYINAEQVQCLRQSTCDAVRAALDRRDWLCGVSLRGPYAR
jgi:hypothetical protein